jgi:hypothetical protein
VLIHSTLYNLFTKASLLAKKPFGSSLGSCSKDLSRDKRCLGLLKAAYLSFSTMASALACRDSLRAA